MLRCTVCAASKSSRQWRCPCSAMWNACALHANSGFMCQSHDRGPRRKRAFLSPTEGFSTNNLVDTVEQGCKRRSPPCPSTDLQQPPVVGLAGNHALDRPPPVSSVHGTLINAMHPDDASIHTPVVPSRKPRKRKASHISVQYSDAAALASLQRMRAQPIPLEQFFPSST